MLIGNPEDDRDILEAEDEAIRAAAAPQPEPDIPAEGDIARLIARLTDGPPEVHQG